MSDWTPERHAFVKRFVEGALEENGSFRQVTSATVRDAIAEIERLNARLAEMRAALEGIRDALVYADIGPGYRLEQQAVIALDRARAALAGGGASHLCDWVSEGGGTSRCSCGSTLTGVHWPKEEEGTR